MKKHRLLVNLYCGLVPDRVKRRKIRRVLLNQDRTEFLTQQNAELLGQACSLEQQNKLLSDNVYLLQQQNKDIQNQYNDVVSQYSDVVSQYNDVVSQYNGAISQYNDAISQYNELQKYHKQYVFDSYNSCQKQLYMALNLPKYDYKPRAHSVLLIEPNPYHGEIQPGFVKYFQDLGYNVDIFMRLENYLENPFAKYTKNPPRMFFGTAPVIRDWVNSLTGTEYEYIFLSSSAFWNAPREFFGKYLDYLGDIPKSKHGLLMIEHNAVPYLHEYDEEKYLAENRVFALTENNGIPRINPHYFGEFKSKVYNPDSVKFVVVGGINSSSKNHVLLLDTIEKLVKNKITNFQVTVIGNGNLEIPHNISKYISVMGRLNYDDMYNIVNKSDYVLALLDPENPNHNRYKTGTTTGTFQLSLGFNKPIIIEESFAQYYALNNDNAIVYADNNLYNAMDIAIKLSNKKYKDICSNLVKLESEIYNESLENLKKATKDRK